MLLLAQTALVRAAGKSGPPPITTALITSNVDLDVPAGGYTALQVEWISAGADGSVYISAPLDEAGNRVVVVSGGSGGGWGKSVPLDIPVGATKVRIQLDQSTVSLRGLDAGNSVISPSIAEMSYSGWSVGSGQFYTGGSGGFQTQYGTSFEYTLFEVGGGGAANSNGPGSPGASGGLSGGAAATGTMPAGRGGDSTGTQAALYGGGSGARGRIADGLNEVNGTGKPGCAYITWL